MLRVLSVVALEQFGAHFGPHGLSQRGPRRVLRRGVPGGIDRNCVWERHDLSLEHFPRGNLFDMVDPPSLALGASGVDDAQSDSGAPTVPPASCDSVTSNVELKCELQRTDEQSDPELSHLDLPVPLTPFSSDYSRTVELERALVAEAAMKTTEAVGREDMVFEDEWLLVFNKPSGIYSEHVLATVKTMLGYHNSSQTAADTPDEPDREVPEPFAHLVNRLDRDTSGVLVLAKCKAACGKLTEMFTKREVEKTYVARCAGKSPSWSKLTIQSGHGRSRFGAWRVYSVHDIGKKLPGRGGSTVKDMKTHLHVLGGGDQSEHVDELVVVSTATELSSGRNDDIHLESYPEYKEQREVVIRAFPLTGRTHQIRLHCCYLGLPLIGDVKYGGPHEWNGVRYDSHCLHAESLSFSHPVTSQQLSLVAPLPRWAVECGSLATQGHTAQ